VSAGDPTNTVRHYIGKGPSGIKSVALFFYRLLNDKSLPAEELIVQGAPAENTRIYRELPKLRQMISSMDNNNDTTTSISEPVSVQLRVLAELATNVITALNHSTVKNAVIERIEVLLIERC
jgi:hypothetical protein